MSDRYARQTLFWGIGHRGQARLAQARVAIVGCGALGTVMADQLARAGVGFIRLIDRDYVEWSNLQRQLLFDEADAAQGAAKAAAAAEKLARINTQVEVEAAVEDLNADTVDRLLDQIDLVLDGTDNFETRHLLNEACVRRRLPWIYCAAIASHGITATILPGQTPCLRCLFPDDPPPGTVATCDTAGVIGPITHLIASLACAEALKLLVGARAQLSQSLVWVDVWNNLVERTRLGAPAADCSVCQRGEYAHLQARQGAVATVLCGREAVQVRPRHQGRLDLDALARRWAAVGAVTRTSHLLRGTLESFEITLFPDGRAIIKGTDDPRTARALYARYIGL